MMGSIDGFTRFTIMCSLAQVYNPFAERILKLFLQHSQRYFVPCFSSFFFYLQYAQGELDSGLTFIYGGTNSFVLP